MMSTGVKAKEIYRQSGDVRDPPLPLLEVVMKDQLQAKIPRLQEHIIAARLLYHDMQLTSRLFEGSVETFSKSTVNDLLGQIAVIHDKITSTLSPRVHSLADDVDNLSAELTTTFTLDVKRLNDGVNLMIRRRKRRIKWVRRAGYVVLEWTLLGIMWLIWMCVIVVRVVRGVVGGVLGVGRWLMFVD
jgi:hypothetical protein